MRCNKGFTLIELMISIAIIAIIASIAIPGLITARKSSNASSAFGNLKSFATAMSTYIEKQDDQKYPANLDNIDEYFSHIAKKAGYNYTYISDQKRFVYYAYPEGISNGNKIYFVDETSRIFESIATMDEELRLPSVNLYTDSYNRVEDPSMSWEARS